MQRPRGGCPEPCRSTPARLLALLLALSVGLFGLRSSLDFPLAPTTLVVESVGTIVLLVTTAMVFRARDA